MRFARKGRAAESANSRFLKCCSRRFHSRPGDFPGFRADSPRSSFIPRFFQRQFPRKFYFQLFCASSTPVLRKFYAGSTSALRRFHPSFPQASPIAAVSRQLYAGFAPLLRQFHPNSWFSGSFTQVSHRLRPLRQFHASFAQGYAGLTPIPGFPAGFTQV